MPSKIELKMKMAEHEKRIQRLNMVQPEEEKQPKKESKKKNKAKSEQEPVRTFLVDEEIPTKEEAVVDEEPVLFDEVKPESEEHFETEE